MEIKIPPLQVEPPAKKRNSVFAQSGDVTLHTSNNTVGLTVKGLAVVDYTKTFVGASGRGQAFTFLQLPEAEAMLAALTKAVEEIRRRAGK